MNIHVLCGAPGSGKTTWAKSVDNAYVVSADDYFVDNNGVFNFRPELIYEAHQWCLNQFLTAVRDETLTDIIVDNTNISLIDMAPYVRIGQALRCDVFIRVFAKRFKNVHGVPQDRVLSLEQRLFNLLTSNTTLEKSDTIFWSDFDGLILRPFGIKLKVEA